ncbi:hypothetical protein DFAR_270007 [Desulfarculales bacterium]
MHGPLFMVGGKRRGISFFVFIDDMSRRIAHAEFYRSEGLSTYKALRQALLNRGLSRKLYLDSGPAFRSNHLLNEITAYLGHRPGPLITLRAPEQGQDRKILPHRQVPFFPRRLHERYPSGHQ